MFCVLGSLEKSYDEVKATSCVLVQHSKNGSCFLSQAAITDDAAVFVYRAELVICKDLFKQFMQTVIMDDRLHAKR